MLEKFPRHSRVRKRKDFLRAQGHGQKCHGTFVLICSYRGASSSSSLVRLGVTVTKKVDKRACRRNRFKRYVREWFRRRKELLAQDIDIIVIAKSSACEQSYQTISNELSRLSKKAKLI